MRFLTIQRKKAFPSCLVKAQVYIEDPNGTLTIAGSPCRLLGTLKNGEQKSFPVDEQSRQVFLIFNPRTKDKLNSSVTIPAGTENVFLTGKYTLDGGAFPFRFEGVPLTPQQQARAQEQKKKQSRNTAIGIVVGVVLGLALVALGSHLSEKAEPKTFVKDNFSITLTDQFEQAQYDDFAVSFESDDAIVFANYDPKSYFGNISVYEYAQIVCENSGMTEQLRQQGQQVWVSYRRTVDGKEFFYMTFFYESQDEFWLVNFSCPVGYRDKYESKFTNWASTVKFGPFSQI